MRTKRSDALCYIWSLCDFLDFQITHKLLQIKSSHRVIQCKSSHKELSTHQITENNDLRIARGGAASISSVMVSIITMNRNGLSAEPCCKPTSILTAVPAVVFTDVVQSSYISLISSTYTSGTPALCRQYQIRFTRLSYLHYVPEPSIYYPLPEFQTVTEKFYPSVVGTVQRVSLMFVDRSYVALPPCYWHACLLDVPHH